MSLRIQCFTADADDPARVARFWADALGWRVTYESDEEVAVEPPEGVSSDPPYPDLLFIRVPDDKVAKNRWHLDLRPDDQDAEVARLRVLAHGVSTSAKATSRGS